MDVRFPYEAFAYREAIKQLAGVRWEPRRKSWEVSRDLLKTVCLLAVEYGYGFKARNTDGSEGTHVVKITGFKIF